MRKYIGGATFIGVSILWAIWFSYLAPDLKSPTESIPHNYYHPEVWSHDTIIIDTVEVIEEDGIRWYTLDTLVSAIMFIESSYNDSAYRADEDAVGCLQIRKCMVNDVNRILKRQKLDLRFTYSSSSQCVCLTAVIPLNRLDCQRRHATGLRHNCPLYLLYVLEIPISRRMVLIRHSIRQGVWVVRGAM